MNRGTGRAGRCHRRPTDADFARFPVGTRVSVAWGVCGRLTGIVVGRTQYRLRVALDGRESHRNRFSCKDAAGVRTYWGTTPSPFTVHIL